MFYKIKIICKTKFLAKQPNKINSTSYNATFLKIKYTFREILTNITIFTKKKLLFLFLITSTVTIIVFFIIIIIF